MNFNWWLDGWIIVAGVLCAVSASLLGNFLVLRKMSMLGDAISHAILPGLAIAFFISESRSSWPMFAGAVAAGLLTAVLTEWIRGFGQVDEGASMGVVFTGLFALGLLLIVQAADKVDLDAGCVLYGAIEATPLDTVDVAGLSVPRVAVVLGSMLIINLVYVLCFYKELKLTSFDPALATALGINASWMHYSLMTLVAVTAVASFESVGNILVVAMFIVPPATAYLLTDRLPVMIVLSAVIGAFAAVLGHLGAVMLPRLFGFGATVTAGMMAVAAGVLFFAAIVFAPEHGLLPKVIKRIVLSLHILSDDVMALLYRLHEAKVSAEIDRWYLHRQLASDDRQTVVAKLLRLFRMFPLMVVLRKLLRRQAIELTPQGYRLTAVGMQQANDLVRSHRLWEQYLVTTAGVASERIHGKAEKLEHFTDRDLRDRLDIETDNPIHDPHGTAIPPESPNE